MNPEAHRIVEELLAFSLTGKTGSVQSSTEAVCFIALRTARLQVVLAEEQEKAAARMEQQTDRVVRFTKGLYWFTAALLLLGVVQIVVAIISRP